MKKVLIGGMSSFPGGIESVIMNYLTNFDLSKFHFDFLFLYSNIEKMAYSQELEKMGCKIFYIPSKRNNPIAHFKALNNFFKIHGSEYDTVWFNANDLANIDVLKVAKKFNIKHRIIHSHNSQITDTGLNAIRRKILHQFNKNKISHIANEYWACSKVAAQWMYPARIISNVEIIKNAINPNFYKFNSEKRNKIRNKYHMNDSMVIGNVGRLFFQKNQIFMLDIIHQVVPQIPNIKLVLVGDGPDKQRIVEKIKQLQLQENVLLVGKQSDMQGWYSAFDIFLFPSLFEGLSVALLEAQANGVSILASDRVSPNEIQINDNIAFVSLNKNVEYWKDKLIQICNNSSRVNEVEIYRNFVSHGYEIKKAAKILEQKL